MFKRMLSAFGVGGPTVDTVLDSPHATPGQVITGQVRIQGGSADAEIGQVVLALVTNVRTQQSHNAGAEFHRVVVDQNVRVAAGQPLNLPFRLHLPWETPITAVGNTALPGVGVGVRTDLVISGAPDKGDLDPVLVHPMPSQDRVLDAFGELGFQFRKADVEAGHLHGVRQELGFYQEIEFYPPAQFANVVTEVELTFVADPDHLHVILEADKRGGAFQSGGDAFGHFRLSHSEAKDTDWAETVTQWLSAVAQRRPAFGGHNPAFGGQPGYGQQGHHDQHRGRRGPGMGAMIGGAAAGMVGGMIIGDMLGDAFDGDDSGGEE
ncbi:Sporulation control protein Spo0M [Alloactinosynnema sp. L-07]|uniref:sporulation protein n=1 Tax=Alloactinosynnema sp. L-07 TaxID=1653480 RepID=UPI00065EF758|nr:sporulation protein [Alloactinosynnema sp. L-07]CRK58032.1 Sporulation control protein Spo0M [Alloactinosynnema sp. L-07]